MLIYPRRPKLVNFNVGESAGGFVGKKKASRRRERENESEGEESISSAPALSASPSLDLDIPYIHPQLRTLAVPIESVCADPQNENKHDARSIKAIAASLREFGQRKPIVANGKTGFISSGNGTHAAAKTLGWEYIAVIATEDDPAAHAAWRITDNRTADFSDFDEELLQQGLEVMKKETPDLFLDLELADLEGKTTPAEAKEVEVKETYALLVEFPTEAAQKKHFDKWTKEGMKVQVRTI